MARYVRWFEELRLEDVPLVGGKNASLGEMYRELAPQGVRVPNGFAVDRRGLPRGAGPPRCLGRAARSSWTASTSRDVRRAGAGRRALPRDRLRRWPAEPVREARSLAAYRRLQGQYGEELSVAVRSSATAEDLPTASFAGQHETSSTSRARRSLLDAVRRCLASLFTDRAISYRIDQGFDHFKVALSVGVHEDGARRPRCPRRDVLARHRERLSATSCSSPAPTASARTSCRARSTRTSSTSTSRPSGRAIAPCCAARSAAREMKMVYAQGRTREAGASTCRRRRRSAHRFCLTDDEVLTLADCAIAHRGSLQRARPADPTPMDIEWAKDGLDGELYIVQARPETVASQRAAAALEEYTLQRQGRRCWPRGRAVGSQHRRRPARASSRTRTSSPSSSPARCWSPTRRRPTGSR